MRKWANIFIRFAKRTRGATGIVFALSLSAILVVIGASFDYSSAGTAKQRAQGIADSIALAAAKDANNPDVARLWRNRKSIERFGFAGHQLMQETNVQIKYNDNTESVTVIVSGKTPTTIMGIMGVEHLGFKASSTVAYPQNATRPVSLFIVVDNSGSMNGSDPSGGTKISNARSAITDLMTKIGSVPNTDPKIVRTGVIPFSSGFEGSDYRSGRVRTGAEIDGGIVDNRVVSPKWGALTDGQIALLTASGNTYPVGSIEQAHEWMKKEKAFHKAASGEEDPLLVVLFMSDGANYIGNYDEYKYQREQPNIWSYCSNWRWEDVTKTKTEKKRVYGWYKKKGKWKKGWHWEYTTTEYTEAEITGCSTWANVDNETNAVCKDLKDDGVEVYTIGYNVGSSERARATAVLKNCATSEDHYQYSENGDALEKIFKQIGDTVLESMIRITS